MPPNRNQSRGKWTQAVRVELLEQDADEFESAGALIRNMLVGVLISTTTAAILLAINVLVLRQ